MNHWKKKLILTDIWQNGDVPESEVHLVGKEIANRLKMLYPDYVADDVLYEIISAFDNLLSLEEYNSDPSPNWPDFTPYDDFNARMSDLYDWADEDKRLWIQLN